MGFADAVFGVAASIFFAEIAQHDIRRTFSFFSQLFLVLGIAVEYILGLTGNWSVVGCVSAAFPFTFFVIFIFRTETPAFPLIKDKSEATAKKSTM